MPKMLQTCPLWRVTDGGLTKEWFQPFEFVPLLYVGFSFSLLYARLELIRLGKSQLLAAGVAVHLVWYHGRKVFAHDNAPSLSPNFLPVSSPGMQKVLTSFLKFVKYDVDSALDKPKEAVLTVFKLILRCRDLGAPFIWECSGLKILGKIHWKPFLGCKSLPVPFPPSVLDRFWFLMNGDSGSSANV